MMVSVLLDIESHQSHTQSHTYIPQNTPKCPICSTDISIKCKKENPCKPLKIRLCKGFSLAVRERIRTPDTLVRSHSINAVFTPFVEVGPTSSPTLSLSQRWNYTIPDDFGQ